MPKTKTKVNRGTIHLNARRLFIETGNVLHAVVAIGELPENPPKWALDACAKYFCAVQMAHADMVEGQVVIMPRKPHPDDVLLEKVAQALVDFPLETVKTDHGTGYRSSKEVVQTAIKKVVGNGGTAEADLRRLRNKWNAEGKGLEYHPRLERVREEDNLRGVSNKRLIIPTRKLIKE